MYMCRHNLCGRRRTWSTISARRVPRGSGLSLNQAGGSTNWKTLLSLFCTLVAPASIRSLKEGRATNRQWTVAVDSRRDLDLVPTQLNALSYLFPSFVIINIFIIVIVVIILLYYIFIFSGKRGTVLQIISPTALNSQPYTLPPNPHSWTLKPKPEDPKPLTLDPTHNLNPVSYTTWNLYPIHNLNPKLNLNPISCTKKTDPLTFLTCLEWRRWTWQRGTWPRALNPTP